MIKLYYTGAKSFEEEQKKPARSLGGYISCSVIPNALINNLFADIGYTDKQEGSQQIRVLAIKNESNNTLVNVKVYIQHETKEDGSPSNMADFYIGFASPNSDECGLYGELIADESAEPYQCELKKSSSELQKISLPNIENNQFVLLYLQRKIDKVELTETEELDAIQEAYEKNEKVNRVENVQLVFEYS